MKGSGSHLVRAGVCLGCVDGSLAHLLHLGEVKKTSASTRRSCSRILLRTTFSGPLGEKTETTKVVTIVKLPEGVIEPVFEPSWADSLAVVVSVSLTTEFVV